MPNNLSRNVEIEKVFRILGLDSMSERERMTKIIELPETKIDSSYHIYTVGDTKAMRDDDYAKSE